MFGRPTRVLGFMLIVLAAPLLVGCPPQPPPVPVPPRPAQVFLSVQRLARDLELSVAEQDSRCVKLTNRDNWVYIYPDPNGQANVNGRRLAARGTYCYGGEMYVPASLESAIRGSLVKRVPPQDPPIIIDSGDTSIRTIGHGHIMIDAGHGGHDGGARSVLGYNEKGVNLDVALRVRQYLQASKVKVSMTRSNDTFVELEDRAAMADRAQVDLFVAIHADSAERASAAGFSVYISRNAGRHSRAAAAYIERSLRSAGFGEFGNAGAREAGFKVLVKHQRPAVLVELGFLSNRAEAARLNSPAWRDAYARAIAGGIIEYLKRIP